MAELVPVNELKEKELKDKLAKYKVFGSPEQFIEIGRAHV